MMKVFSEGPLLLKAGKVCSKALVNIYQGLEGTFLLRLECYLVFFNHQTFYGDFLVTFIPA